MSAKKIVTLAPTGIANVASVTAAFERLGATVTVADNLDDIGDADRVILPGVGAFGAAVESLGHAGFADRLQERIDARQPTLAICLGLQLLASGSDEAPAAAGLGVLPGRAERFTGDMRVPHLGWNRVQADPDCALLESGWAYFAHSYRLAGDGVDSGGWSAATCDYGGPFLAACERGPVLACQFHPELSGEFGRRLLARWLAC